MRYFSWVTPFFCFVVGYCLVYFFIQRKSVVTPDVVGKSLQECISILANDQLSVRLLRVREDSILPEGTIINQTPLPQQKIRLNQSIFVTVAKKPKPVLASNFVGDNHFDIIVKASKEGLSAQFLGIESDFPRNKCIAQTPVEGGEIVNKKMIFYISLGNSLLYVVPDFRGALFKTVEQYLKDSNVTVEVFGASSIDRTSFEDILKIVDQNPMAGSIVDLRKMLSIQFQVSLEKWDE